MKDEGRRRKKQMRKSRSTTSCIMIILCTAVISFFCLLPSFAATWILEDELRNFLANNYPWEEIEVNNVQALGKLVDDRPERILVEKGPLGKAVFSFIFANNEKLLVKADVRAFGWVVMSKRSFEKRHVIQDEDTYLAKMDIRKMPGSSVKNPERILGKSLKRSIIANIPIVEDMLEMSQIVARGKMVELILNYNGLSIKTTGMTKEKGYVGMPVKAINLSSKKEVRGVLINENTVKVEL